jgi:2-polyprenyl-3-methyl-5-hydroxy-6-metoxy-1,4-benzoquinol methylase
VGTKEYFMKKNQTNQLQGEDFQEAVDRVMKRGDIRDSLKERFVHTLRVLREHYNNTDFSLLDLGCNTGILTRSFARLGYRDVQGVDISEKYIRLATLDGDQMDNLHYSIGDATNLDHTDNTFDLAVCFEVLEHISGYQNAVKETVRVTKDSGHVLISVPKESMVYDPGHINVFTERTLTAIERRYGRGLKWHNAHSLPQYLMISFEVDKGNVNRDIIANLSMEEIGEMSRTDLFRLAHEIDPRIKNIDSYDTLRRTVQDYKVSIDCDVVDLDIHTTSVDDLSSMKKLQMYALAKRVNLPGRGALTKCELQREIKHYLT